MLTAHISSYPTPYRLSVSNIYQYSRIYVQQISVERRKSAYATRTAPKSPKVQKDSWERETNGLHDEKYSGKGEKGGLYDDAVFNGQKSQSKDKG